MTDSTFYDGFGIEGTHAGPASLPHASGNVYRPDGYETSKASSSGYFLPPAGEPSFATMQTSAMPTDFSAAGVYAAEPPPQSYVGKSQMPPTPPESFMREDCKDLGMMSQASSLPYMLSKPLPVRRFPPTGAESHMFEPVIGPIPSNMLPQGSSSRRPRSEKKPIPDEQKDGKYFERRRRNNAAAKKSRDSRKAREDDTAMRASLLEKENTSLRAHIEALRSRHKSMQHLILQRKAQQRQ